MADTNKNKKTTTKVEQENLDLADKLLGRLKDVNKQISQGNKILSQFNTGLDLTNGFQNKILINQSRYNDALKSQKDIQDKAKSLNQEILRQKAKIAQYEGAGASKQKLEYETQLLNQLEAQAAPTLKVYELNKRAIENSKTSLDLTDKNLSTLQEIAKNKENIGKEDFKSLDYTKEIQELEEKILESTAENNTNLSNTLKERKSILEAAQKESEAQDKINTKISAARDKIVEFGDSLLNLVPGGKEGFLGKMLGLDTISKNLKDNVGGAMADAFKNAGGGAKGFFSAASAGASTLMTSLLPILPLLLAIAGVVSLVKLFMDADAAVGELSKSLNITYQEGVKVYSTANEIAGELGQFGVKTSDVTKQMTDLSNIMGINLGTLATTNAKAKEFLETSTLVSKRYGTTADENLALNTAAAMTGTTLDKMALTVEAMSSDGLIPAGELMKDISKVSKGVLLSFKGNVVALARAAKQAKLMGTTLDKMQSAGESLLNIESSIVAQNKARMMLGRNINLDAARYYALQGDTESLMQEMVKAAGSVEEYEAMSVLQKKALAEAMGMQVSDLDDMMAKQKELEAIGLSQTQLQEMLNASTKEGFDMEKALSKVAAGTARDMLKEKLLNEQNLSTQEKLAAVADKFKTALFKAIEPLLPAIEKFANSLIESNGPVMGMLSAFKMIGSVLGSIMKISIDILRGAWYPIGVTIDFISAAFNKLGKLVKYIKEDIFGMKDATGEAGDAAKKTGASMEIIKYIALAIGNIIGGWFILKGLKAAKDGISSMYDKSKGIGSSLKDAFKSIKEGKFPSLSKKKDGVEDLADKKIDTPEVDTKGADKTLKNTTSFADKLKSAFKSINDTLKAIFKGIGNMLKNIFNFIKDTVKTILDFVKNVMKDIFKTIKDVAKELTSTLQSLMQNIGDLLNSAIDVIKDVGTNLIGAVGELLGEVISVIDEQGTALVEALGNIGNALAENVMKVVNTLLDGLGQAASKLPGIMNSLGQAIGSFFAGLSTGLVTFAQAMATPTPFFGMPVGLILLGMAMGIAAALRIAAPGIAALGTLFEGLGKGIGAVAPAIAAAGTAISSILNGIGEVIESVGKAISTVITAIADSIVKFSDVDAGNIAAVGLSLAALGAGLLALTAGEVVSGIASFFGANPIDTLKELETVNGDKIKSTGSGVESLANALSNLGSVDDSVVDKGNAMIQLMTAISEIEYDEIDSLSNAIDDLAKSYDSLLSSIKNITDEDIARMQQIASATPKDVGGGGITDSISNTLGSAMSGVKDLASSAISSVGSFFGFGEEEPKQEIQQTNQSAVTSVKPIMEPVTAVNTRPAVTQSETTINNQNNNSKLEGLLRELITKVDQPVIVKLGNKTVAEMSDAISLRKSYGANINGYRS